MVSPSLRVGLENELRAEREQRQSLQKSLQREQDNSIELRTQLQQLQGLHGVSGSSLSFYPSMNQVCQQVVGRLGELPPACSHCIVMVPVFL